MLTYIYIEYNLYGKFHHKACTTWDEAHAELFNPDCEIILIEQWKYNTKTRSWVA